MRTISIPRRARTRATPSKLVSAAPLQELLAQLQADHARIARLTPNADIVAAIGTIVSDLAGAIDRAADLDIFMTIDELSEKTGRPKSPLTRLCRNHPEKIGATKFAGSWSIHWPTFEKFYCSAEKEPLTEEAA